MYLTTTDIINSIQKCITYNSTKKTNQIDFSKLPDSIALTSLLTSKLLLEVQGQTYRVEIDCLNHFIDVQKLEA